MSDIGKFCEAYGTARGAVMLIGLLMIMGKIETQERRIWKKPNV